MRLDPLRQEMNALTHDARMRRMVEVGRRAATDPDVAATIARWERGGHYERQLALQSCFGSRDGAHVLRALADPSRSIRGRAARLVPIICDDAQAQASFDLLPERLRRSLLGRLRERGRQDAGDAILTGLAERDDPQLDRLLSFGSPALLSRHFDRMLLRAGEEDWRRLVDRHPEMAARELTRRAESASHLDARLRMQANAVLHRLAETAPEQALALVQVLSRHIALGQLSLQRLAERRPVEVADLLLAWEGRVDVSLERVVHRLNLPRVLALLERRPNTLSAWTTWLPRLDGPARAQVYAVCARGWRGADGALDADLVALLPRDLREAEARRHLDLPALATRPAQRLPYSAFLPWEEARAALDPFVRRPEPELRAVALAALISCVRFHRDRLPELLPFLRSRKNEQDPVRLALLSGLAGLPPGIWRADHLEDLGRILRDALDARDLSPGTANAGERLVMRLLPFHPEWSASWMATLVRERGQISIWGLGEGLSDRDMRRIAPALLPVLKSWETRERVPQLLSAARSLGRRLKVFPELGALLEHVLRDTRDTWMAAGALDVIYEHRRERIPALIPELIREDKSWVTQSVVHAYLHRHRQDLLTPFLGRKAYRGRFSTGKTRFVLPLSDGFHRWTPAQQETFARTLGEVISDAERDSPAVFGAIRQLAALPDVPPDALIGLASLSSPRPAAREAALRALGGLDAGQGVPALLEALDDDRARIAIYALRRSVTEMPPPSALALLRAVPLAKVTVAKETVRLLGDLHGEDAFRALLEMDRDDLHRDVRVALIRALWPHVERPEARAVMERAAAAADPALPSVVGRIPADRLSPEAQRWLAALMATLLVHPDAKVRLDALQRCMQMPLSDPEQALLQPLLRGMESPLPDESGAAAQAVFATYTGRQADLVAQAIARVLPNRRALHSAVDALVTATWWNAGHLAPTVRAVVAVLETDPLAAALRAEVATRSLPTGEVVGVLAAMADRGDLHADALAAVVRAVDGTGMFARTSGMQGLEGALATHADERLRRIGLAALVSLSRMPAGWTEEHLQKLRRYREDPSPLVAAAAQFTFPPGE